MSPYSDHDREQALQASASDDDEQSDELSLCDFLPHRVVCGHRDCQAGCRRDRCDEADNLQSDDTCSLCDELPPHRGVVWDDDQFSLCDELPHPQRLGKLPQEVLSDDRRRELEDDEISLCDELPLGRRVQGLPKGEHTSLSEDEQSICDDLPARGGHGKGCEDQVLLSENNQLSDDQHSLCDELPHGRARRKFSGCHEGTLGVRPSPRDEQRGTGSRVMHAWLLHENQQASDENISLCDELPHRRLRGHLLEPPESDHEDQLSLCDDLPPRGRMLCELSELHESLEESEQALDDQLSLCDELPSGRALPRFLPGAYESDDEISLCDELPLARRPRDIVSDDEISLCDELPLARRPRDIVSDDEISLCDELPLARRPRDIVSDDELSLCDELPRGQLPRELNDVGDEQPSSDFSICDELPGRARAVHGREGSPSESDDEFSICDELPPRAHSDGATTMRQRQHRRRLLPALGTSVARRARRSCRTGVERLRRSIAAVKAGRGSPSQEADQNDRQTLDLPATVPARDSEQTLTISVGEFRREFIIPRQVFSRTTTMTLEGKETKRCERPSEEEDQCAVCLENFELGDVLRVFPCEHRFHTRCIDAWLHKNHRCPVCRHDPLHAD